MRPLKKILYVFAVDTGLPRGDSTHVREFLESMKNICGHYNAITLNRFKGPWIFTHKIARLLHFRLYTMTCYFKSSYHSVYVRWFPGLFLDLILLRLLRKKIFVELNAVISDEDIDLRRPLIIRLLHKLDERCIFALSDRVIAVSEEIERYYYDRFGRDIIEHVNNGVNMALFNPDTVSPPQDLHAITRDKFTIGFVGSLSPWQDIETMLKALHLLIYKKRQSKVRGIIVGVGKEEPAILRKIVELNLRDYVILTGGVPYEKVPAYISLFSVGIAPLKGSRNKNTGSSAVKVFEYLAMKKPVIISEVGSFSDMIKNNNLGLVYQSGDASDLASKILDLSNNTLSHELTSRGREWVARDYSWSSTAKKIHELIIYH